VGFLTVRSVHFKVNPGFRRQFRNPERIPGAGEWRVEGQIGAGSADETYVAGSALRASPRHSVSPAFASVRNQS